MGQGSRLSVANHLSHHPNDKQELLPALDNLRQLPKALGQVDPLLGDTGYVRAANVKACEQATLPPLLATGRAVPPPAPAERFADPGEAPHPPDAVARRAPRLPTPAGKALDAKRQATVEPVVGIIKPGMGFRQLLLRGLPAVQGEWNLGCIAYNLKRLQGLQVLTG